MQDAAAADEDDLDIEGDHTVDVLEALRSSSNAYQADQAATEAAGPAASSKAIEQLPEADSVKTPADKSLNTPAAKDGEQTGNAADPQPSDKPSNSQPASAQQGNADASEPEEEQPVGKKRGVKRKQAAEASKDALQQQGSVSRSSKSKAAADTAEEEEQQQTGKGRGGRGRGRGREARGRGRGRGQKGRGKARSPTPESSSDAEQDQTDFADALDSPSKSQQAQSPSHAADALNVDVKPTQHKADPPETSNAKKKGSAQDKQPTSKRIRRNHSGPSNADQKEVICHSDAFLPHTVTVVHVTLSHSLSV